MAEPGIRIGVIGDVHMSWCARDELWFSRAGYDLLLFVGDLATYARDGRRAARSIARLGVPALVMPGNHDAVSLPLLAAEALCNDGWSDRLSGGMVLRAQALAGALGPVPLVGYSAHSFDLRGLRFSVIAGRPHSMGGRRLSFPRYLRERFGISSLAQSSERLCALVDECETEALLFVAHNGPTGLGAEPTDLWGCDFKPELGDFGDEDLRTAIDHAVGRGKRVLAVVAGHMHHRVKGGLQRGWCVAQGGICYVNAARVPRIALQGGALRGHHVRLRIDEHHVDAQSVWV